MTEQRELSESESESDYDDDRPVEGVCDYPDQVHETYPTLKENVWFKPIARGDQDSTHGWRWRKWGEYIGKYKDVHMPAYIFNADGTDGHARIDRQWIFFVSARAPDGWWFGPPFVLASGVDQDEQTKDRALLLQYDHDASALNSDVVKRYRRRGMHYDVDTGMVTDIIKPTR
jgi:hypothetical protein